MKNERFINAFKGGGITLAIIYSTLSAILEIVNYFLFGKDIASYSFNGNYGKLVVFYKMEEDYFGEHWDSHLFM